MGGWRCHRPLRCVHANVEKVIRPVHNGGVGGIAIHPSKTVTMNRAFGRVRLVIIIAREGEESSSLVRLNVAQISVILTSVVDKVR